MNEMVQTPHHYICRDFTIRDNSFGQPFLFFRNGHRDMDQVRRAVRLCGMRIVNIRSDSIQLEVDNGESGKGKDANCDNHLRTCKGGSKDPQTEN